MVPKQNEYLQIMQTYVPPFGRASDYLPSSLRTWARGVHHVWILSSTSHILFEKLMDDFATSVETKRTAALNKKNPDLKVTQSQFLQ